jgi:hypothetical protein
MIRLVMGYVITIMQVKQAIKIVSLAWVGVRQHLC